MGLRPVNSDSSFEMGLKKAGLSLKMPEDEEEQRDAIRVHAKDYDCKTTRHVSQRSYGSCYRFNCKRCQKNYYNKKSY